MNPYSYLGVTRHTKCYFWWSCRSDSILSTDFHCHTWITSSCDITSLILERVYTGLGIGTRLSLRLENETSRSQTTTYIYAGALATELEFIDVRDQASCFFVTKVCNSPADTPCHHRPPALNMSATAAKVWQWPEFEGFYRSWHRCRRCADFWR